MKNKLVNELMKDGYSRTVAELIVDKYWEPSERHGCLTFKSRLKFTRESAKSLNVRKGA
jgi:hypothetical protein